MIKLKILFAIVLLLCILYVSHFATYYFMWDHYQSLYKATEDQIIMGRWNHVISLVGSLIIFFGLVSGLVALSNIIKEGYFTPKSKKWMLVSGYLLLVVAVLSFIMDAYRLSATPKEITIITTIMLDFVLCILAIIILIAAEVVNKGVLLQQENDLTI